ncbi:MAG: hypothetical protein NTZ10_01320 [Candidatus Saganbacteria bacterium]|nr:hypothetical protein [Candidatus Saganbacteria bacterium]
MDVVEKHLWGYPLFQHELYDSIKDKKECNELFALLLRSSKSFKDFLRGLNSILAIFSSKSIDKNYVTSFQPAFDMLREYDIDYKLSHFIYAFLFEYLYSLVCMCVFLSQCKTCSDVFVVTKPNKLWCSKDCRKRIHLKKYYHGTVALEDFVKRYGKKQAMQMYGRLTMFGYIDPQGVITKMFGAKKSMKDLVEIFGEKNASIVVDILSGKQKNKQRIQTQSRSAIRSLRAMLKSRK